MKGRVPQPGTDIQALLETDDDTTNPLVISREKTSVRNPFRKLWEDRGVVWPSTSCTTSTSGNTSTVSIEDTPAMASGSSYFDLTETCPNGDGIVNELKDDFYPALGIQESLKSTKISSDPQYQFGDAQTHSQQNQCDTTGEFQGLMVLLDACSGRKLIITLI